MWICKKFDFFRKKRAEAEISQISDSGGLDQRSTDYPDITGGQDPGA